MGDYKLKSDPHYIVPENQRVNAERKRRQMVLLQESVHYIKMALNERFLALRDLKARIIKNIQQDNIRLRAIYQELGLPTTDLFEPTLDASEWPEHREIFTQEQLLQFEQEREKERIRQSNAQKTSIFSSAMGSFDDEDEKKAHAPETNNNSNTVTNSTHSGNSAATTSNNKDAAASTAHTTTATTSSTANHTTTTTSSLHLDAASGSSSTVSGTNVSSPTSGLLSSLSASGSLLDSHERHERTQLLLHERDSLLSKMNYAIHSFDHALNKLRREKFKLDSDLKTTDLKVLTLYQELQLLKDFEESENKLFAKLAKARNAKAGVVSEMTDCEKQLSHKLSEIKAWQEKDKQVMQDFNQVVGGEKSEFYAQLLKIFKKKVKRAKKKTSRDADLDEDDDSDNGEDDDSDEDDNSDESDSDEDDDDSCPLHCDSAIYEKVLELREKRLEQEEVLAEFNKAVQELNKQYDRHVSKERLIDKELSTTEGEIEAFQSEKQRALNLIEVTVPLKLNQMKFIKENKLPKDITNALIFTATGLTQLRNRITELGNEKVHLTKQFKELKKQHKVLLKELQVKREQIAVEKKKCEDVQMLKFGQIIDLNILEKVGVDEGAEDLKQKLKTLEASSVSKLDEWEEKLNEASDELSRVTSENTMWLEKVSRLTKAQYELEDQLNTTTKNVHVADSSPLDDQADMERRQLLELVQLQEREIDALKAEIHVLRRKGGHVYTPSS